MLSREKIIRFTFEGAALVVFGIIISLLAMVLTDSSTNRRIQNGYRQSFGTVLDATSYEPVQSPLIKAYSGVEYVYEGLDEDGNPVGYIVAVSVVDRATGLPLELLVGVDHNTAELTGIARTAEDTRGSSVTDDDIAQIEQQITGQQIPVAYGISENMQEQDITGVPVLAGLNDGIYYAQNLEADRSGYIDYVEISIENGFITSVQWDAFNVDMNIKNRRQSALDGVYSVSGLDWATQSYLLCHALIDVQDPDLLAMKSDGTTDIVDGVTVNIRTFIDLVNECIGNSRAGFDKDMYFAGLQEITDSLFAADFESLGIVNDEGFIVFSFEDYPGVFVTEDGTGVNVRQKVTGDMTDYTSPSAVGLYRYNEEGSSVTGSEDGVREDATSYGNDSIDGIPISQIKTYIDGIDGRITATSDIVTAVNTSYRFLKDYLNWMA